MGRTAFVEATTQIEVVARFALGTGNEVDVLEPTPAIHVSVPFQRCAVRFGGVVTSAASAAVKVKRLGGC